jgi:hypothetical protein
MTVDATSTAEPMGIEARTGPLGSTKADLSDLKMRAARD